MVLVLAKACALEASLPRLGFELKNAAGAPMASCFGTRDDYSCRILFVSVGRRSYTKTNSATKECGSILAWRWRQDNAASQSLALGAESGGDYVR